MYPKKAVELCEGDIECAGFTYSGAKSVGQPFYIYFYRYITPSSISMLSVTNEERVWTSYRVKRNFVVLPGKRKSNKKFTITKQRKFLLKIHVEIYKLLFFFPEHI